MTQEISIEIATLLAINLFFLYSYSLSFYRIKNVIKNFVQGWRKSCKAFENKIMLKSR